MSTKKMIHGKAFKKKSLNSEKLHNTFNKYFSIDFPKRGYKFVFIFYMFVPSDLGHIITLKFCKDLIEGLRSSG